MSSIIGGYNYDIRLCLSYGGHVFISYRQKDNKGDRWVSMFVDALKTELEATFKEDISIYFDENPHDRLQETHNVDKSLEVKLKCLIFIPVLSQTYCDPKSYAWNNEFLAFIKMTENDRFGKDVRLRSGNVASRILPIRIHDLEQEDIKLFEKETGSVLRAMDFVFKTASGVNRPLKANEDHPHDNLNKTFYADQINKVAHAIKEIISGMKEEHAQVVKEKNQPKESVNVVKEEERKIDQERPAKSGKWKLLSMVAIVAVLIIAVILAYPKIFKKDKLEFFRSTGEVSVAVMPFQNITKDNSKNFWQEIIQNKLITSLSNSEELKVRQTESIITLLQNNDVTNYASITPSIASRISQKLDANVFIHGSINQIDTIILLNAKLIDSETEEVFKSFQIEGTAGNILSVTDSLSVMVRDYLIISILKKEVSPVFHQFLGSTKSPEALGYFIDGQNAFWKRDYPEAGEMLLNAIGIDSNFTAATVWLAFAYGNQGLYEDARKWCLKAYEKRDKVSRIDKIMAEVTHAHYFGTPSEVLKYYRQALDIDDQQAAVYYNIGNIYNRIYQYDKAIPEYEKSLELFKKWGIKPMWVYNYTAPGLAYHKTGEYKKERKLYRKAEKDFPGDHLLIYRQAVLALSEGKMNAANEYIEKYKSIRKENSDPEANISTGLAEIYSEAGILDKAEANFREALSLESENPERMNNLAWFLIDTERNIKEGLEFIDKALELSPDIYYMSDTKGWGLYKQGKYQEALELLERSWELKPVYNHKAYLHLEAAKKAVAGQR